MWFRWEVGFDCIWLVAQVTVSTR